MTDSDITILTARRRRYRHHVHLDYEYETERNDQYRSLWCEKCKAFSALSCMCLKNNCNADPNHQNTRQTTSQDTSTTVEGSV